MFRSLPFMRRIARVAALLMLAGSPVAPLRASVLTNNIVLNRYLFGDDAISLLSGLEAK